MVAEHVSGRLTTLLGLRGCRFERGRYGGMPRMEDDGQIRTAGVEWDLDQFGMPDTEIELLCISDGGAVGRFVLRPTPGVTPELLVRRIGMALAAQVAAAYIGQAKAA
jgi:hypothetical protein